MKSTKFHRLVLITKYISKAMDMADQLLNIRVNYKKKKTIKLIAWYPSRWWNFCMSKDEKKQNQFLLSNAFNASVVYDMEVLEHFDTENYA